MPLKASTRVRVAGATARGFMSDEPNWIELERHMSVPEAAAHLGISPDTFRRNFRSLIRKISPRRCVVKVRDLLAAADSNASKSLKVGGPA
jgi:hypothetical protein